MAGGTRRAPLGAGIVAGLLILSGCAETPTRAPERDVGAGPGASAGPEPPVDAVAGRPGGNGAPADPVDAALFGPVREALARGSWIDAHLALPKLPEPGPVPAGAEPPPPTTLELWIAYYAARIAHLRGDRQTHAEGIATLLSHALPEDLAREILSHRLTLAERRGDALAQFQEARSLLELGGHGDRDPQACRSAQWRAAQRLAAAGTDGDYAPDPDLRAWLDLARVARITSAREAGQGASAWLTRHPDHSAGDLALALRDAALRDATSSHLALALPLSGSIAAAGDAVTRGFLAAFYADQRGDMSVEVIDSRRFARIDEALAQARAGGASVVVGPLGKRQVGELIAGAGDEPPILTLNRPEVPASAPTVLQLALAPEDEAEQLAGNAFAEGARRAFLIRPEGVWGDRIEAALRDRWQKLGGALPTTALFASPSGYSDAIRDALDLDRSAARSTELRALFPDGLESSGRRRADLDAVFLLTRSGDEARALKPLIDYHYAGDLPVYALSTADSGGRDRNRDRDLEGLRLLVMPWRLAPERVPGLEAAGGSFDALHALGADAYGLAQGWWRLQSPAQPVVSALTAELRRDADGVLRRRLATAEFSRGVLNPR